MSKRFYPIVLLLLAFNTVFAQHYNIDSLRRIINEQKRDTNEVLAMAYFASQQTNIDSGIIYAERSLLLAKETNAPKVEAHCLLLVSDNLATNGYFNQSIAYLLRALHIYESVKDTVGITESQLELQGTYRLAGDYKHSLEHAFLGRHLAAANHIFGKLAFPGTPLAPLFEAEISKTYFEWGKIDSSAIFAEKAIAQDVHFNGSKWNFPIFLLGTIQTTQGKYISALENYREALPLAIQNNFPWDTLQIFGGMSTLYLKKGDLDSSIFYGKIVTTGWTAKAEIQILLQVVSNLAQAYKLQGNKDSALKFVEMDKTLKDSIYNSERMMDLQHLTFNEQFRQQEIASAQLQYRNKVRMYALGLGFILLFLVASFLWRNNQLRRKAYRLLENQKQEIALQKEKIEKTLDELKTTQTQLIQSAKMASLGELTAGIAHEIQNPLNFVNNFSEVSVEILDELKEELKKQHSSQEINKTDEILEDLTQNLKKINHHGKRADSIVKSMLQHSGSNTGQKEFTDINTLADEYLRLSYHGLRATNKSFNVTIQKSFDETIGKINIVSQNMGRVLLNLYNNAFYAVMEKGNRFGESYQPMVIVNTKKLNGKIEIRVRDNGIGISQKVVDKIFHPFFTTKPSGKGTGLGLSLSYDIVVKEHGGAIKVETKEGEYAEFIIQMPVNQ